MEAGARSTQYLCHSNIILAVERAKHLGFFSREKPSSVGGGRVCCNYLFAKQKSISHICKGKEFSHWMNKMLLECKVCVLNISTELKSIYMLYIVLQ